MNLTTRMNTSQATSDASTTAGIGLLLMAALAGFGNFVAVEGLVTPGDAARTATDITASEGLFRFGIATLFAVVALDVVVAWALYRVLLLALWLVTRGRRRTARRDADQSLSR